MPEKNELYNSEKIASFFDEFAVGEWERLVKSPVDEVSLYLHTHYLQKFVQQNNKVLEIGAGAGRFTQILAHIGAKITVADISQGQLDLNQKFAAHFGFNQQVQSWEKLDICNMNSLLSEAFDCVVAYGGPLSYVMEKRNAALAECVRVLKPAGYLLCSVMSLWGSAHRALAGVLDIPPESNQIVTSTGDLIPETVKNGRSHAMHLFRANEFRDLIHSFNLNILNLSASGCLSANWKETLAKIRNDKEKWGELLRMELEASAEPGCLDMGTHLIAIAQK